MNFYNKIHFGNIPRNLKGGIMQGFIIENISNIYKVKTENGNYEAIARGK